MTMLLNLFKQTADRLATMNNVYVTDPGDQTTNEILLERAAAALTAYETEQSASSTDHMMIKIGGERLLLPAPQAMQLITLLQSAQRVQECHWVRRHMNPASPKYMLDADPYPCIETQIVPRGDVAEFESYEEANRAYEAHKATKLQVAAPVPEAEAA